MSTYDAPNQQVVRPDGSAPWDEGDGGSSLEPTPAKAKAKAAKPDDTADTVVTPPGG